MQIINKLYQNPITILLDKSFRFRLMTFWHTLKIEATAEYSELSLLN